MGARLRPARPADYPALAGWIPDAEACRRWAGPRVPFPFAPEALEGLLAVAPGASFALEDGDGTLAGFGQYWVREPGAAHLGRIVVAPGQRGRGLGRSLCRRLMTEALAATRAASLTLRVYRGNEAARALYASLGFREEPSETDPDPLLMRVGRREARAFLPRKAYLGEVQDPGDRMESHLHAMTDLFAQLGLPATPEAIQAFIEAHRPEAAHLALPDAPFWTPSQAEFLRDQIQNDADWASPVDDLDPAFHPSRP